VASSLTFAQVEQLFTTLGIKNFGAALPEGRIHWTNEDGAVVAHARCQAVLSYAPTNSSLMWCAGMAHFEKAGVPCLPAPDDGPAYEEGVDEDTALELATQAAQLTGAQFLYAAPSGGGSKLFLAIRDFHPGAPEEDASTVARRVAAARAWALARLQGMAGLIGEQRTDEAATLLAAFEGEVGQQAEFVVNGTPLAARLSGLGAQAALWSEQVVDQPERVAYEISIAARAFDDEGEA
jgi:hypothetical protein